MALKPRFVSKSLGANNHRIYKNYDSDIIIKKEQNEISTNTKQNHLQS